MHSSISYRHYCSRSYRSLYLLITVFCTTTLFGCSTQTDQVATNKSPISQQANSQHSKPQHTKSETKFLNPVITPNNTKLFTYIVVDLAEERRNNMPGYWKKEVDRGTKSLDETRKRRNPQAVIERRKTVILAQLDKKIAESGFCQQGHTIINSHFELARSTVKGKCNDSATKEDRIKFTSAVSTTDIDPLSEGLMGNAEMAP